MWLSYLHVCIWFNPVLEMFLCWPFYHFFDSVMPPQSTTDCHVVISTRVRVGLKGISRVIALSMSLVLGIRIRLKGLETRINLSSPRASSTGKSSLGASSSLTVEGPT